ncbi:DUF6131 family protein [Mycobacterium florentinum]
MVRHRVQRIKPGRGDSDGPPGCGCSVLVVETFNQTQVVLVLGALLVVAGLLVASMELMGPVVGDRRHYC